MDAEIVGVTVCEGTIGGATVLEGATEAATVLGGATVSGGAGERVLEGATEDRSSLEGTVETTLEDCTGELTGLKKRTTEGLIGLESTTRELTGRDIGREAVLDDSRAEFVAEGTAMKLEGTFEGKTGDVVIGAATVVGVLEGVTMDGGISVAVAEFDDDAAAATKPWMHDTCIRKPQQIAESDKNKDKGKKVQIHLDTGHLSKYFVERGRRHRLADQRWPRCTETDPGRSHWKRGKLNIASESELENCFQGCVFCFALHQGGHHSKMSHC